MIARARNASHLGFLEALFIGWYTPEHCAQKEFVRTLGLFQCHAVCIFIDLFVLFFLFFSFLLSV